MVTVFRFVCLDAFSFTLKEFSRLHYCLIIKVLICCCALFSRQLCYISISCHLLSTTFFKTFFETFLTPVAPMSLTTVFGFLWFLLLFFVVCRSTTLLSYQSYSLFASPFFTFFHFWYFGCLF